MDNDELTGAHLLREAARIFLAFSFGLVGYVSGWFFTAFRAGYSMGAQDCARLMGRDD